ncbi:hypothetical protein [Bosea sp. RAC05]|uniref:hypothetical protein n=1 Tax=Bosea sp. RAC05 TaxID=1842539 RepID=UPI00083E3853|nr:hypothetical protein [Bosea sp. RAC05]AOG02778.1 hypothetical protein BSY19_4728 [Bosea sp. RAC05]
MPNRIVTRTGIHEITPDYVEGALASRMDAKKGRRDGQSKEWVLGFNHDQAMEHIRFGRDLIHAVDEGKTFDQDPASPWCGRSTCFDADGALAMMSVTGTLEAARHLTEQSHSLIENSRGMPATEIERMRSELGIPDVSTGPRMRNALMGMGFPMSTGMSDLIKRRIYFEKEAAGQDLTAEDIEVLEAMAEPRQNLVLALGYIASTYWTGSAVSKDVAWKARKSHGWVAATTMKMGKEGQGFLVSHSANGYIWLTPKGWTAYRHLKELREALSTAPAPAP